MPFARWFHPTRAITHRTHAGSSSNNNHNNNHNHNHHNNHNHNNNNNNNNHNKTCRLGPKKPKKVLSQPLGTGTFTIREVVEMKNHSKVVVPVNKLNGACACVW